MAKRDWLWIVKQWLLNDVHILISRTCECVTWHGKSDVTDMMNLRTLRKKKKIILDYLGASI